MTNDAGSFEPVGRSFPVSADPRIPSAVHRLSELGYLVVHEGKTFHQFNDLWHRPPRYLIPMSVLAGKQGYGEAHQYYRLALRAVARSNDSRTSIAAVLPPGVACGNSALCERRPDGRPNAMALILAAIANSFVFDWCLRQKSSANVNFFILNECPVPAGAFEGAIGRFLAHAALRLTANHEGYRSLWLEQVGTVWNESVSRHSWPVLQEPAARWAARASVDALIASLYGITRRQYFRVLGDFPCKQFSGIVDLCMNAFDAVQAQGVLAYIDSADPYRDVAMVQGKPASWCATENFAAVGEALSGDQGT